MRSTRFIKFKCGGSQQLLALIVFVARESSDTANKGS